MASAQEHTHEACFSLPHVVVFPFPAQGHINPALQFAQRLASAPLSLCTVTFINTSHNIDKLRASHLDLGPRIRLQALADDGDHGLGHGFFERVEHMGDLLETLLLDLLQTPQEKSCHEPTRREAKEDGGGCGSCENAQARADLASPCNPGYGDLNIHADTQAADLDDFQSASSCNPGYVDLSTHAGECHVRAGLEDFQSTFSCNSGYGNPKKHDNNKELPKNCSPEDVSWGPPICIVSDTFLGWVQDIADKLNLPRFILYTPSPAALVLMLSLPDMLLRARLPCDNAMDEAHKQPLNLPGLTHTLCLADIPSHLLLAPSAFMFNYFIRHSKRIPGAAAVLLNTFEELQSSAIDAARVLLDNYPCEWDNFLHKHQLPRVIPVGPLLPSCMFNESRGSRASMSRAGGAEDSVCLQWLEKQEPSSVVYVSFGSMAELPEEQIHELAWGLEASGKPFLWVVRGESARFLPPGFNVGIESIGMAGITSPAHGRMLVSTKEEGAPNSKRLPISSSMHTKHAKGLVVSWAPQLDVLSYPSVALFLSHCGWNSTLEALSAGVPVLGWPLFAEQKMNCRFLVDELEVAMEFSKEQGGLVGKKEVERVIREGIDTANMKRRASEWKALARNAVADEGTSQKNVKVFGSLLASLHASIKK